MWEKFKASFRSSLTILWARIVSVAGVGLMIVNSFVEDPNLSSALQGILQPKYIPYWILGMGIITELVRRRTAKKDD